LAVHQVFEKTYVDKLRSTGFWDRLPVLLVGGGSLYDRVQTALKRVLCPYTLEQPIIRLRPSGEILPGPGLSVAEVDSSLDFLLVAYGLSFPAVEHPRFTPPSGVADFQKPPEAERFDANDMYGK
jgi:hypothetical protein